MNPKNRFDVILIIYYGLIQTAHLVALVWSFVLFQKSGELTLLAWPPAGGWSEQARHFLITVGTVDAVNVLLSLLFVYGYFSGKRWWFWLGVTALTISMMEALIYTPGTLVSGAWSQHFAEYALLVVLYVPIVLLYLRVAGIGLRERYFGKSP